MRFVLGLLFLLLASPAFADDCPLFEQNFRDFPQVQLRESTNERLIETVKRVRAIAGIDAPYLVCEWSAPHINFYSIFNGAAQRISSTADHVILASSILVERSPDRVLLGLVAHEFAHLKGGLDEFRRQVRLSWHAGSRLENEIRTDELAAQWVTPAVMREGLNLFFDVAAEEAAKLPFSRATISYQIETIEEERSLRVGPLLLLEIPTAPF